jgi:SAM-dependent methyltransferase
MEHVLERTWNRRVGGWHAHVTGTPAFTQLKERLLGAASPQPSDVCVDLGAGTGFITFALAPLSASVLAVDIAPEMIQALADSAASQGLHNVTTKVCDLSQLELPEGSVDLIVSNYALHHLLDAQKRLLVARAARWLRPGGRIVIADMMFGRGGSDRDREILRQKAASLARKGPGGWWRIAKNVVRLGLGVGQEHPASPQVWERALRDAGFADVSFQPVVAEAGLIIGRLNADRARKVRSDSRPARKVRADSRPAREVRADSRPAREVRADSRAARNAARVPTAG